MISRTLYKIKVAMKHTFTMDNLAFSLIVYTIACGLMFTGMALLLHSIFGG